MKVYRAAVSAPADRIYFGFSFGPFMGFWTAFDAAQRLGCLCVPGGGLTTPGAVACDIENRVTVLCCTPSYALRLGRVALAQGSISSGVVRTSLSPVNPAAAFPARARIAALAGCETSIITA